MHGVHIDVLMQKRRNIIFFNEAVDVWLLQKPRPSCVQLKHA